MPIAMAIGAVFYQYIHSLSFITPFLIAVMLFISYCNISLKDIRITRLHVCLLFIQLVGSFLVYLAFAQFNEIVAQAVMICIMAPTATSAIVITGMLGGNVVSLGSYTLISNLLVVIVAPIIFVLVGYDTGISFLHSAYIIFERVALLLILPFVLSLLLKKTLPLAHEMIRKKQSVSFYLWSVALIIVTAKTVKFIFDQDASHSRLEIIIALFSLLACIFQFSIGRLLGSRYNDTVAGGQGLGQKNTILAIWMAQTYLNPIASIGPGSYVLWQNIINSFQVWKKNRK